MEKLIIFSALGQTRREDVGKTSTESMIWLDRTKFDDIFNRLEAELVEKRKILFNPYSPLV